jgi:hypothetical protein
MNFKITKSFNYFQATGKNEIRHQSNKQINRQTDKQTNRKTKKDQPTYFNFNWE